MNYEELLIKAIITLIFAVLAGFVIPYINSKVDAGKMAKIKEYTLIAVRAAEQIFNDNPTKREYVLKYITEKAQEIGLKLTEQDISNLVEYAVNLIKYGEHYTRNEI